MALALHRDVQARREVHTTLPDLYEADWVDLTTQQAASAALDAQDGPPVRRSTRLQAVHRATVRGGATARPPAGRRGTRVAGRASNSRRGRASTGLATMDAARPEAAPGYDNLEDVLALPGLEPHEGGSPARQEVPSLGTH